jgi:hypothetical protein
VNCAPSSCASRLAGQGWQHGSVKTPAGRVAATPTPTVRCDSRARLATATWSPISARSRVGLRSRGATRAITFAEAGLRVPDASQQTRALCARQAALGHALGRDAAACERRLHEAHALLDADSPPPPWASAAVTLRHVRAAEAQCWLWLQPRKAIPLYESVLSAWPRDRIRDGGLHQARFALTCAAAGERDRAEAEGRKALAIARATNSASAKRELRRLGRALGAAA